MSRTIGFSGSQHGMTVAQYDLLRVELVDARDAEEEPGVLRFLHGCCVGSDEQAAALARELGFRLVGLPGAEPGSPKRARIRNDIEFPVRPPLIRNRIIAKADRLIATPAQPHEVVRSGTWSTIRYARQLHRPVLVIYPNGSSWEDPWRHSATRKETGS